MAEHDPRHEPVYAAAQLRPLVRRGVLVGRTVTAVVVGLAVLLGLATPALASSGGPRPGATAAAAGTVTPDASGFISGHVAYAGGDDGRAHYVIARDGQFVRKTRIRRRGDYTLYGLPAGSYRVTFDRVSGQSRYEAQFWNGHPESAGVQTADRISLGAAGSVSGVDGTLRQGGVISGSLVDAHQRPLADCLVQAYTSDEHLVTRAAFSAADGTFAIAGLTTGAYLVRVQHRAHDPNSDCDGGRGYLVTRSGGALGDRAHARPVTTRQGRTTTVGSQVYATAGRIVGHATLPAGSTPHDHFVVARNVARPGFAVRARIHSDGSYAVLGLVTGSYRVTFDRLSGQAFAEASFYRGHPESTGPTSHDPVAVTRGDTTTLSPTSLRAGGSLTGTLADAAGRPLNRCQVQAFTADNHLVTRTAITGDDGSFTIGGLTTGQYLVRVLHGPRRSSGCSATGRQFYDGGSSLSPGGPGHPARLVKVQVGRVTTLGRLTYALGASISGVVHFPGKRYADDQYVVARRGHHAVRARIASDGSYLIPGLTAGSYRVTFDRISGTALYAPQFYAGHAEPETRASANRVVLTAGQQRRGVNATLKPGRHITGRLVNPHGDTAYCQVQAFTPDGSLVTRGATYYSTSGDGSFDISGLSAGRYYLRVLGDGYGSCNGGTQYLGTSGRLVVQGPGRLINTATTTSLGDLRYASRLRVASAPTITGTARVGGTLTAAPGQWSPASGLTFTYQWLSAGQPIAGATASTYSPTATTVGHRIEVEVTASKPGYVAQSARSAPTSAVAPGRFVVQRAPRITGQPTVGQTLRIAAATISPAPTTTTFRWLRDGSAIAGATAATYKVVGADRGHALTARVTYSRPGYLDRTAIIQAVTVS